MGFWQRTRALRWWIIAIVMLGTIINYLVRQTLGVVVATDAFQADVPMTREQYSWVTGVFQAFIMLQPVVGYILDRIGLRSGMAIFATAWGLLTFAHGWVTNWQGLALLRGGLGFAEGTSHTAGLKVVSEWFPAKERGLAGGIYNLGASAGIAIAGPLVAIAIGWWNWRAAFYVAGALALLWVVLWLLWYRTPEEHGALSDEERALIRSGQEAHVQASGDAKPPVLSLLGRRNFWGIALPRFLADPTWATLTFWLPLYLSEVRGLNLSELAIAVVLPFVAADIGCLFGPALVLWLERRGIALIDARRWTFSFGALLMTSMIFVGGVTNPVAAVALLSVGAFAHQTLSVTCITMASDLFRRNEVGTVAGMAGTLANLGVLIFTLLIGALVARIGYNPFFVALGVLDLIAAALLWTLVRKPGEDQGSESGWIPILLGVILSAGLTLFYASGLAPTQCTLFTSWSACTVPIAMRGIWGFGVALALLGLAIEIRARRHRTA
ncbi:ACS family hexuronate transporter-like MFS transporter [Sphingomonas naasensis]|uniref:MFS transporter n=1 Tax=Sphingomonas naasensis TaxID=1344951 RepID=A0A4S1WCG4_9SPHN|nr:MFS transporter [Sphingomonas naasensis]NIJ22390.1 ACS family hexuronate transporter-like MFS transporter [Sphingomonas naasensis]TGX40618.1 MFS transporter [Sphingomonas naasensis]